MGLSEGSMLERYEIVRLVGRGGMGEVYHAMDTRLRRPVALKILREDKDQSWETGAGGVARLMREAQAAAALNHPNSVAIYDVGDAPFEGSTVHFIAMELIIGQSFRRHSKASDAGPATKVGWLIDAARALWAAHKLGIIHRDIKPSNIMVSDEGAVKVLDFGLAKPEVATDQPNSFQTKFGQILGTPRYMAPEQIEGIAPDPRSDQFAFGLTAYELLSGEYAGGPLAQKMIPLEAACEVPSALSRVVMRTLANDPKQRYATMDDVANALRDVLIEVEAWETRSTANISQPRKPDEITARQTRPPVDPALHASAKPSLVTTPMTATPLSVPTPGNATVPLARPIAMQAPFQPPSSRGPGVTSSQNFSAPPPSPSSRAGVTSSQNFSSPPSMLIPPQSSLHKATASGGLGLWIGIGVAIAVFALLAGTLLAVFLR